MDTKQINFMIYHSVVLSNLYNRNVSINEAGLDLDGSTNNA